MAGLTPVGGRSSTSARKVSVISHVMPEVFKLYTRQKCVGVAPGQRPAECSVKVGSTPMWWNISEMSTWRQ